MKPIADARLAEFEDLAMDSVKQLKAYFKYEGANPEYFKKGRLAAGAISAYARIRASETNRMSVELAARRFTE